MMLIFLRIQYLHIDHYLEVLNDCSAQARVYIRLGMLQRQSLYQRGLQEPVPGVKRLCRQRQVPCADA